MIWNKVENSTENALKVEIQYGIARGVWNRGEYIRNQLRAQENYGDPRRECFSHLGNKQEMIMGIRQL